MNYSITNDALKKFVNVLKSNRNLDLNHVSVALPALKVFGKPVFDALNKNGRMYCRGLAERYLKINNLDIGSWETFVDQIKNAMVLQLRSKGKAKIEGVLRLFIRALYNEFSEALKELDKRSIEQDIRKAIKQDVKPDIKQDKEKEVKENNAQYDRNNNAQYDKWDNFMYNKR
ncbi:MAG: hypothetical protein LBI56_00750 [Puniceicoccales bacterium]|jgi:hypothetical protein|nr:hypothetical protein [Puniceicoccales bacterium]